MMILIWMIRPLIDFMIPFLIWFYMDDNIFMHGSVIFNVLRYCGDCYDNMVTHTMHTLYTHTHMDIMVVDLSYF